MKNKKADISMNVIVYAAIALLILVILVAFATGRLGGLFKGITQQTGEDINSIRSACTSDCNQAKITAQSSGANTWKTSSYCTREFAYDSNKDGELNSTESYHCYDNEIGVDCSVTLSSGVVCSPDSDACSC